MATATVKLATATRKTATTRKPSASAERSEAVARGVWFAHAYVYATACISAMLNAWACFQHAPSVAISQVAAIGIGLFIPLGAWKLAKVSSNWWSGGQTVKGKLDVNRRAAVVIGIVATAILALSLSHCAESINLLTGMPIWQAWLMAIAIDAGMVGCEMGSTIVKRN